MTLIDRYNRIHDYLRISVTDRCNLHCHYCVPNGVHDCTSFDRLLSDEEIVQIVKVGAELGIRKLRLTGGEPLVRKELPQLIATLNEIDGIEDIALTTNGIFLPRYAEELKQAGLTRLNISLDSLDEQKYKMITRNGKLKDVFSGIERALALGFNPIKINVVLMRDYNIDEIEKFLRWTLNEKLQVRFIEYMPIGDEQSSWSKQYQSLSIVEEVASGIGAYREKDKEKFSGPANVFSFTGAKGSFGLIHPISNDFCKSCNRLRLTADGYLKSCLFWEQELAVKSIAHSREKLVEAYHQAMIVKPENHEMGKQAYQKGIPTHRNMSAIGG
ncbi:GTP 3',8-cyclase MoaA [Desertibacillus haloalkaliphilus]|uniref:GTP 3',8-cyclase MoaA n=1 Tax=Desertibacillus haloalkaliphilus TaxID=1328930 RepID=UPI001C25491C|nr:GTP 3',8-cyclase MoaA [Desertibacillus haloalkaliphilus]MBU8908337.1 GTP 3',8-cyclase MoaA [Desertibacillus haloalkaliphilus]